MQDLPDNDSVASSPEQADTPTRLAFHAPRPGKWNIPVADAALACGLAQVPWVVVLFCGGVATGFIELDVQGPPDPWYVVLGGRFSLSLPATVAILAGAWAAGRRRAIVKDRAKGAAGLLLGAGWYYVLIFYLRAP